MKRVALVTGASRGIGFEIARAHASSGGDLVLVARSQNELMEAKRQFEADFSVTVEIIAKDLSCPGAAKELFDEMKRRNIDADYLINNAGFGDYGHFPDADWNRYAAMIELNITALTHLCHSYIIDWKGRKEGKILNVASVAAFQPGPGMAVYFATKSYVLSFSEAIAQEVCKSGISVTALCPGLTATFFMDESKMKNSAMVRGQKLPSPAEVARFGYRAMLKGKRVAVHGLRNIFIVTINRFLPRKAVVNAVGRIM